MAQSGARWPFGPSGRELAKVRPRGDRAWGSRRGWGGNARRFYGLDFDPAAEVLVTAGATEAIAATLLALTETGGELAGAFEYNADLFHAPTLVRLRGQLETLLPELESHLDRPFARHELSCVFGKTKYSSSE